MGSRSTPPATSSCLFFSLASSRAAITCFNPHAASPQPIVPARACRCTLLARNMRASASMPSCTTRPQCRQCAADTGREQRVRHESAI